jgi:hypothetical protein
LQKRSEKVVPFVSASVLPLLSPDAECTPELNKIHI